jgi:serine/threonine-protein kinase
MPQGKGKRGWKSWLPLIIVGTVISCAGMSLLATGIVDFMLQMADRRWRQTTEPFNKAMTHVERGEFDEAITLFTNEIDRNAPSANSCLLQRGRVYRRLGRYADALADFDELLRREPGREMGYYDRAGTYYRMGRYDEAVADCDRSLRLSPGQTDTLALRGNVRRLKGELETAVADFTEALRLRPKVVSYWTGRALVYFAQKRYREGMADLNEALRLDDDDTEALIVAAWWLSVCPDGTIRDGTKAVAYAKKACELSGWQDGAALNSLAAACAETGDFAQAVERQIQARDLAGPNDALLAECDRRIELYKQRKPHREE